MVSNDVCSKCGKGLLVFTAADRCCETEAEFISRQDRECSQACALAVGIVLFFAALILLGRSNNARTHDDRNPALHGVPDVDPR